MAFNLSREWARLMAARKRKQDREHLLTEAVAAVVEGTDPRIRAISGYHKKLRPAIQTSVRYVQRMVDHIPGPVTLAPSRYGSDPVVHACFSSIDDMNAFLAQSRELQDVVRDARTGQAKHAYGFLVMQRQEKNVFAPALVNGQLRQDIAQVRVSFANRQVVDPAISGYLARRQLMRHAFSGLIASALNRLIALQSAHDEDSRQIAIERTRLQALQHRRQGLDDLITGADEDELEIAELQQHQGDDSPPPKHSLDTLEDYLDQIVQVFAHPDRHLHVEPASVHLTRMNRMLPVDANTDDDLNEIEMADVRNSRGEQFSVIAVRVPCNEMPPAEVPSYLR